MGTGEGRGEQLLQHPRPRALVLARRDAGAAAVYVVHDDAEAGRRPDRQIGGCQPCAGRYTSMYMYIYVHRSIAPSMFYSLAPAACV